MYINTPPEETCVRMVGVGVGVRCVRLMMGDRDAQGRQRQRQGEGRWYAGLELTERWTIYQRWRWYQVPGAKATTVLETTSDRCDAHSAVATCMSLNIWGRRCLCQLRLVTLNPAAAVYTYIHIFGICIGCSIYLFIYIYIIYIYDRCLYDNIYIYICIEKEGERD